MDSSILNGVAVMSPDPTPKPHGGCVKGHGGVYLGSFPASHSTGAECITYCVEKILDCCNVREALMRDAFVDIRSNHVTVYFVDEGCKVEGYKRYDLARISYCCANHVHDGRILSWIYRQEVDTGFQLECHAVRFESEVKASCVASRLYMAFTRLYAEVESAVCCSSRILSKQASVGKNRGGGQGVDTTEDSKQKRQVSGREKQASYVDNLAFENIEEHCLGMEYETDNVFTE